MNYYKMRAMIAEDMKGFLARYPETSFDDFSRSMVKKYGATSKMVAKILEEAFGLRIEGDKVVRIDG